MHIEPSNRRGADRRAPAEGDETSLTRRAALAALAAFAANRVAATPGDEQRALFIPGYDADEARGDAHAARALPAGYDGPATSLTKVDPDTGRRDVAVFPVQGHVVSVDRARGRGVLHAQSRDWLVGFDPETLDMTGVSAPFANGFVGGGHALFTDGGDVLLTAERAPYGPYLGDPAKHYGRIAIRDPETLREIGRVSSHGVAPHDVRLLNDGATVAIANYGAVAPLTCGSGAPEPTIEPSLTFVDLASGRLLDKATAAAGSPEIRHFAAASRDDLLAIRVAQGDPASLQAALGRAPEADDTEVRGCAYLPAPPTAFRRRQGGWLEDAPANISPDAARHGLSVAFDPVHEEYLATYPSSHALHVTPARSSGETRVIDLAALGLRYPCGLALDLYARRYFVAGAFGPVMAFSLGAHRPLPAHTLPLKLSRHSHIVLA